MIGAEDDQVLALKLDVWQRFGFLRMENELGVTESVFTTYIKGQSTLRYTV